MVLVLPGAVDAQDPDDLYGLTLEELGRLRTASGGSLTRTVAGRTPASVTTITRQMVQESGARSLDELLEIFVPNLMRLRQAGSGPDLGLRGIISNRDNQILLLVNGRTMNQRSLFGAVSERFLPLLGDIEAIDVVRGPGSAIYGPGAINGVISIRTTSFQDFSGFEVSGEGGLAERFRLAQVRMGAQLAEGVDLFAYYGVDSYDGASVERAPVVFSVDDPNGAFRAGVPIDSALIADNAAAGGRTHHKAHVEIAAGDARLWGRFVRGGSQYLAARPTMSVAGTIPMGLGAGALELAYQQMTVQGEYSLALSGTTDLLLRASYDVHDLVRQKLWLADTYTSLGYEYETAMREDELHLRSIVSWEIGGAHSLAAGMEYSREWFGRNPIGLTDDAAHQFARPDTDNLKLWAPWSTDAFGLLGEYQWHAESGWTAFVGGRIDKHTFTTWMASPKAALVYSNSDRHITRLMFNGSVRRNEDAELKQQAEDNPGVDGQTETISSFELRHDMQLRSDVNLGAGSFYYDYDILSWNAGNSRQERVGATRVIGLEAELDVDLAQHEVHLSHAFTKQLSFTLEDSNNDSNLISSSPYGFGNDLQNWPRHISKANWRWRAARRVSLFSSLRVLWQFEGARDYARYNNEVLGRDTRSRTDGRDDAFQGSAFLNVGANSDLSERLRVRVQFYNVLGWVNADMNKRGFFGRLAGFRNEAPAASLGVEVRF